MTQTPKGSTGALWARFRFSVVGPLLSSPPARGSLKTAIHSLAEKTWRHPVTGCDVQFTAVSIERYPSPRRWPSGSISSTAITRTGVTNCTMTTSPRSRRPNLPLACFALIPR